MKWSQVQALKADEFRRLCGVKKATFLHMAEIIKTALKRKKAKGGRPNKLSAEDMVLMTLSYWREYRTYFHVGQSYNIGESGTYKIIRWVEDEIKQHKEFHLPGRKALLKSDREYEIVLMDATESPVERPKKNRNIITQERKSVIR